MYNENLESIKKKGKDLKQKIEDLETEQELKDILVELIDLIFSTASSAIFETEKINKKIGPLY